MDKYEILALLVLSLFLIPIAYVVYVIISIIRSPKLEMSPLEIEPWKVGDQQLTITYRKGARPDQDIIEEIRSNFKKYEELIAEHAKEAEGCQDFKAGLSLSGISFPFDDEEQGEYDFSIDYEFDDKSDMLLEAYFKNGKVQKILSGD